MLCHDDGHKRAGGGAYIRAKQRGEDQQQTDWDRGAAGLFSLIIGLDICMEHRAIDLFPAHILNSWSHIMGWKGGVLLLSP